MRHIQNISKRKYVVFCVRKDGHVSSIIKHSYQQAYDFAKAGKIEYPDCTFTTRVVEVAPNQRFGIVLQPIH